MTKAQRRARLLQLGEALPEASCSGGQHVAFSVRGRNFAYYLDDHHGDGLIALCCKAAPGEQEALVAADPERFYRPAYVGSKGWVAVRLDLDEVDWTEVGELLTESYRLVAPKRLSARLRVSPDSASSSGT